MKCLKFLYISLTILSHTNPAGLLGDVRVNTSINGSEEKSKG